MAKEEEISRRSDRVRSIRNILLNDPWKPHMAKQLIPSELRRWADNREAHGIRNSGTELLRQAADYIQRKEKPGKGCCEHCGVSLIQVEGRE